LRIDDSGGQGDGPTVTATTIWQLCVDPDGASGAVNMARDLELLEQASRDGTATLRLYRFNPPCLSLGRNQRVEHQEMAYVRRPTGGGAVWHENELTYAVAAPIALFGSMRRAYLAIHERIAEALQSLGAEVSLAPAPGGPRPPSPATDRHGWCFENPVAGEILAAGRKVVGSAQVRKRSAFLQHGSVKCGAFDDVADAIIDTWLEPRSPSAAAFAS
jgi:lipoyl(octanoyl) transferase